MRPSMTQPSGVTTDATRRATRATVAAATAANRTTATTRSARAPVRVPTMRVRVFDSPAAPEAVGASTRVAVVTRAPRRDRVPRPGELGGALTRPAGRSAAGFRAAAGR